MKHSLADGRVIRVELLSIESTYFSYLLVNPRIENKKILARAEKDVHRMWGHPPYVQLLPQSYKDEPTRHLPDWRCMAFFRSTPVECPGRNPVDDYSALCVVWYLDREPGDPIEKLFSDGLGELDWDAHAKNFG